MEVENIDQSWEMIKKYVKEATPEVLGTRTVNQHRKNRI